MFVALAILKLIEVCLPLPLHPEYWDEMYVPPCGDVACFCYCLLVCLLR